MARARTARKQVEKLRGRVALVLILVRASFNLLLSVVVMITDVISISIPANHLCMHAAKRHHSNFFGFAVFRAVYWLVILLRLLSASSHTVECDVLR